MPVAFYCRYLRNNPKLPIVMIDVQKITGHPSKLDTKTFRIQALTPVFIGAGTNLIKGVDIIEYNGDTFRLDLNKVYQKYIERDPDGLTSAIEQGDLCNFLDGKNEDIPGLSAQKFNGKCLGQELMDHVRDGFGNPIIPGSSLKGSLKTALMHSLMEHNQQIKDRYLSYLKNQKGYPRRKEWASQELQSALFSKRKSGLKGSNPNFDIGRVVRTTDAKLNSDDLTIVNTSVLNITHDGSKWKTLGKGRGSNTNKIDGATKVSVLGLGFESEAQNVKLSLDQSAFKAIDWQEEFSWETLQNAANKLSKELIEFELDFLEEEAEINDVSEVIDDYKDLYDYFDNEIQMAKDENRLCWIQRLGWGSGWLSMTGMHVDDDHIDEVRKMFNLNTRSELFPKTRKLVLDNAIKPTSTMGWVLMEEVIES